MDPVIENTSEIPAGVKVVEYDIEEGLLLSGSCGRFQVVLQIVTMYLVLTVAYITNFSYYIFDNPSWRCVRNDTSSFCKVHSGKTFRSNDNLFTERCNLNRSEWTYTTSNTYSAVTEFDLVCEKAPLAALASSMVFIGGLIGAITSGKLADLYGRLPIMIVSLLVHICATISCSLVPNIWWVIGIRGVMGAVFVPCFNISMVFMMEFVPSKFRAASGSLYQLTYCISLLLMTLVGYYVRNWREFSRYIAYPAIISLFIILFLPESPRWLLAAQKSSRAEKTLQKIAKYNGIHATDIKLKTNVSSNNNRKNYSFIHLFRYWKLISTTFALGLLWTTTSMLYFAISLESSKLGGNMYSVYAYSTLVEIPSTISSPILCDRFGRKKTILTSVLLAGAFTVAIALVPKVFSLQHHVINIAFAVIAKLFINISYVSIYVWTFEIYPTVIRSQGLSVCAIFDRIGGLCAPFIVNLLHNICYVLPFVIMGGVAIGVSLLGLVLPETNHKPTRENFEDMFEVSDQKMTNAGRSNDAVDVE